MHKKTGVLMTENNKSINLSLPYQPPYVWDDMVDFLAQRAVEGVESVVDGEYRRTVTIPSGEKVHQGWITVANAPKTNSLSITMTPSLAPVSSQVINRVSHLFDTSRDPVEIYDKLKIMNQVSPDMCVPGTRVPGSFDPFEISTRAILGQQVTVKAARTLASRLASTFGGNFKTPFEELNMVFPHANTIYKLDAPIEDRLGPLGITGAKARAIYALAKALVTGVVSFSPNADPLEEMEKLLTLPGFGPWTVQYIGMRAFGWPDAFPHTDYGVKKALGGLKPQAILDISEDWKPWRSYATINLWYSLKKGGN